MGSRSKGSKSEGLTERQRSWLAHARRAEGRRVALIEYAKRHGLKVSPIYEAKRRLRQAGVLASTETSGVFERSDRWLAGTAPG